MFMLVCINKLEISKVQLISKNKEKTNKISKTAPEIESEIWILAIILHDTNK